MYRYQEQHVIKTATMPSDTNLPNQYLNNVMMFMLENEVHSYRKSWGSSVPQFGRVEGVGRQSWVFPRGL